MPDIYLTYLSFQSIKDLPANLQKPPITAPFLDYASCYWGVHTRKELTEHTKSLALKPLDLFGHHVAARMILRNKEVSTYYFPTCSGDSGTSGFHVIAYFGIAEIAKAMIQSSGWEVNRWDCRGYTPLIWAARNNNLEVCEALIEFRRVDPDMAESEGSLRPLFAASQAGHEGIVGLVLERKEVNTDSSSKYVDPPLSKDWDTNEHTDEYTDEDTDENGDRNSYEDRVRPLRECKDVYPDSSSIKGKTPLLLATKKGYKGIVKLLQEWLSANSNP